MIPKVIHYCWFGKKPMSTLALRCIDSWKKYLPDYELRLWNEDTFDINCNDYVKEAYNARKYAFVTDYVRLFAIYHFGGIYMDTDVEVIKNLDQFLILPGFSGFENEKFVPTGIMAAEKFNVWAKEQLAYYDNRHFLNPDGTFDMISNVLIISNIMSKNGFKLDNSYQVYKNCMYMFPKDYFCPKTSTSYIITGNTHCIHHLSGSWQSPWRRFQKYFFQKIIGTRSTIAFVNLKRSTLKWIK